MKIPKCKKTISGKHLFMPLHTFFNENEVRIWKAHGVENPQKCIACSLIDDIEEVSLSHKEKGKV